MPSDKNDGFCFSHEYQGKVDRIFSKYPPHHKRSAVLPLLDLAQRQLGGSLTQQAIEEVARLVEVPSIEILEVASFYTMFNLKPVGKHHIQLCGTTPCWLRGAALLREACESHLGIKNGGMTQDRQFSLIEVECLGACCNAPMVQINDDYYEDLTPESLIQILEALAQGKEVKKGSQISRKRSEPCQKSESIQCGMESENSDTVTPIDGGADAG